MEKLIKGQRYWFDSVKDVSGVYKETVNRYGTKVDLFIDVKPTVDESGRVKGYHVEEDGSTIGFYSGSSYEKA